MTINTKTLEGLVCAMNSWRHYYEKDARRYCWDLMWNTNKSTGAIARPHQQIYVGDYMSIIPKQTVVVVNVALERENRPGIELMDQYKVGLPDPGEHTCDFSTFAKATKLVRRLVGNYRYTVFVHCSSGMSRSIAVAAAASALLDRSTVIDEVKKMAEVRPEIYPEPCYIIFGEMLNGEFPE